MKQTRILMGMPITVEVADKFAVKQDIDSVFAYFDYVDKKFSTYKENSEISRINRNEIEKNDYTSDMSSVLSMCGETTRETGGYFNIERNKYLDPSGLVKGWSIKNAAQILKNKGYKNYYVEAGGDIELAGKNSDGKNWLVGVRNPFDINQIVKVLSVSNLGVATSGTYIRGQHVYNPLTGSHEITDIKSLTVVGPNIYEADRFATAAFAMGSTGIEFIEKLHGFEGYMIDANKIATMTSGWQNLTK